MKKAEKETAEDDENTGNPPEDNTELDDVISEWQEDGRINDRVPVATLHRFHEKTGSACSQIMEWRGDEIPTRHEMGVLFGAGRYWVKIRAADKSRKPFSKTFSLADNYNVLKRAAEDLKRQENAEKYGYLTPTAPATATATATETFQIVKEILSLIIPVLTAAAPTPAPAPAAPALDALGALPIIQKMLKQNLYDTLNTYNDIKRRYTQEEDAEDPNDITPPPEEPKIMDKIIALIEPFFNQLAGNGIAGKTIGATIKNAPQLAEVLQDPELCKAIIKHFEDKKGIEPTKKALENIGLDRNAF